MTTPRQSALAAGQPRYKSTPCKVCGHGERYTSCGNCVACNLRRALEQGKDPRVKALRAASKKARMEKKKSLDLQSHP
jgi:7-cyano-7-deazaguanine synthase in queuosine biosynthesis